MVSPTPGTTTDPVRKAMELPGVGPVLFIDTPGFDDSGELGSKRTEEARKAIGESDIALLLFAPGCDLELERRWFEELKKGSIPVILVISQADIQPDCDSLSAEIERCFGASPIVTSAAIGSGIEAVRGAILEKMPEDFGHQTITGNLVKEGDSIVLVMPQDSQAPKGRLILPQVQTIRELLDKRCIVSCCTDDKLAETLKSLNRPPKLIITDSQVFKKVYPLKPKESMLTSFSILFAGYKGDIGYFLEGAKAIDNLTEDSKVLIAEACTHAPATEDIGRVKIPALLRKKVGAGLKIEFAAGKDFPEDLSGYDLIIHCGACMFNRKYVLSRVERAKEQKIAMTNYGVAIAKLSGILSSVVTASDELPQE